MARNGYSTAKKTLCIDLATNRPPRLESRNGKELQPSAPAEDAVMREAPKQAEPGTFRRTGHLSFLCS